MSTDAAEWNVSKSALYQWQYGVAAVVGLVALLTTQTIQQIVGELADTKDGLAQAGLIVLIAAWIVCRRRRVLSRVPLHQTPLLAIALAASSLVWALAQRAGISALAQLCIPVLIWLALAAIYGSKFAGAIGFAVAYLAFALPVWSVLTPVLQSASVHATTLALQLSRIPAYVHGTYFDLPSGTFEIESGCAGLHFFLAGLSLAALIGEVNDEPLRNRLLLLIFGAMLAIVGNWVRIYCVILAGYLTNMQHYLVRVDHYWFGWGVFCVAMCVLVAIARKLRDPEVPLHAPVNEPARLWTVSFKCLTIVGCAVAVGPAALAIRPLQPVDDVALALPVQRIEWPALAESGSDWTPYFEGSDRSVRAAYGSGDHIDVFAAAYAYQLQGKELSGYDNRLVSEGEHVLVRSTKARADHTYGVIHVKNAGGKLETIWFAYVVGQRFFTSASAQQLYYALRTFVGPVQSSVIALRMACDDECGNSDRAIEQFAKTMHMSSITSLRSN